MRLDRDPLGFAVVVTDDVAVPSGFRLGAIARVGEPPRLTLLLHRTPQTSLETEVTHRARMGAPVLFSHGDRVAVLEFSPGVSLAQFLVRQAESAGRLDDGLACGVVARIASKLADVHEHTGLRAGALDDERVWFGFDGSLSLVGPFDTMLAAPEHAGLARSLTLDVWRLGALAAAVLSGVRNVPPGRMTTELTSDGFGDPPPLPDHTRPIVERALRSADLQHARKIAAEMATLAGGVDVELDLAAVLAGLFPVERARALQVQEELALLG